MIDRHWQKLIKGVEEALHSATFSENLGGLVLATVTKLGTYIGLIKLDTF